MYRRFAMAEFIKGETKQPTNDMSAKCIQQTANQPNFEFKARLGEIPAPVSRPLAVHRNRFPLPHAFHPLHHPAYRSKFADNLKRELPRIPFAPPLPPSPGIAIPGS